MEGNYKEIYLTGKNLERLCKGDDICTVSSVCGYKWRLWVVEEERSLDTVRHGTFGVYLCRKSIVTHDWGINNQKCRKGKMKVRWWVRVSESHRE